MSSDPRLVEVEKKLARLWDAEMHVGVLLDRLMSMYESKEMDHEQWALLGATMRWLIRYQTAHENAMYCLNPNQGEPVDASAALVWLRTALSEEHPNHLDLDEARTLLLGRQL